MQLSVNMVKMANERKILIRSLIEVASKMNMHSLHRSRLYTSNGIRMSTFLGKK